MNASEVQQLYQSRFGGKDAYRLGVWHILNRDYFQEFIGPTDTVLDLGAGYGEFINTIQCGTKYALDLNPDTKERAGSDVEVLMQDSSRPWPLPDGCLDVVFTSNFFEHVSDKKTLEQIVLEAKRCLKPGGRLIAMGPNIKYLPGAYWDFLDHYIPLTEQSLSQLFELTGLQVEKCIDRFLPYTMSQGQQYPLFFTSLYLRLPLAWRFFGKQFLVIGCKT
ncbi:MAG TPA: class I SAM-dependent methyltransferase [Candidatus Paceibacterota bacterium]|nr:class I SAM-dependent methyltransferase [Candidatus Paceibacterota bacterium]